MIRRGAAGGRRGLQVALAAAALCAPALGYWSAQAADAAEGRSAVINWANEVIAQTASASGDALEANRVTLTVAGGPVVIQWSLSYDAYVNAPPWGGNQSRRATVKTMAGLERDGVEIARWTLGTDQAQNLSLPTAQARVTGAASGLFVDHAAGSGRRTYVFRVWNKGAPGALSVSTRTMICEER